MQVPQSNQLHILNGDATRFIFEKTGIEGDVMVWREMLCAGPTHAKVGSEKYWEMRKSFLVRDDQQDQLNIFLQFQKAVNEVDVTEYEEIVLWFEYDLFCQINLIAVLSWLHQKMTELPAVSLICVGKQPADSRLISLGEIEPEKYPGLLRDRQGLSQADLSMADQIWSTYSDTDHSQLNQYFSQINSSEFPYLIPALQCHFRRFPDVQSGLTELETTALNLIRENGLISRNQLVGLMLRLENLYGFGDLQYFWMIDDLGPLIDQGDEGISLNEHGIDVLEGNRSFTGMRKSNTKFGGANMRDWHFDPESGHLKSSQRFN